MKRSNYALASAAAFGLAVLVSAPASAAPAPSGVLGAAQTQAFPGEAYSQYRRYHGGHRHFHGHRGGRGAGAAALGVGLAAGLIGAAIAAQQPQPVVGGGPGWNRYCFRRFGPSFDPGSGTYLGADGYRYPCQ